MPRDKTIVPCPFFVVNIKRKFWSQFDLQIEADDSEFFRIIHDYPDTTGHYTSGRWLA